MVTHVTRSVDCQIREGLSTSELWDGPDRGLIGCWERGREKRDKEPELAACAEKGELTTLPWKRGSLQYLAMWQGLRGEDLRVSFVEEVTIVCTKTGEKTGNSITFKAGAVK